MRSLLSKHDTVSLGLLHNFSIILQFRPEKGRNFFRTGSVVSPFSVLNGPEASRYTVHVYVAKEEEEIIAVSPLNGH